MATLQVRGYRPMAAAVTWENAQGKSFRGSSEVEHSAHFQGVFVPGKYLLRLLQVNTVLGLNSHPIEVINQSYNAPAAETWRIPIPGTFSRFTKW